MPGREWPFSALRFTRVSLSRPARMGTAVYGMDTAVYVVDTRPDGSRTPYFHHIGSIPERTGAVAAVGPFIDYRRYRS